MRLVVLLPVSAVLALGGACVEAWAQKAAEPAPTTKIKRKVEVLAPGDAVQLDSVQVVGTNEDVGIDATGMGSYEYQLRDVPFSNDIISSTAFDDDPLGVEINNELQHVASPSPVDMATGDTRLALRGFPAPLLRNGFVTMGASDMLNTSRTIAIQGALVPVLGRAAPGGIQDFITWRPRAATARRFDYSLSSLNREAAAIELNGPAVPKKAWHRIAVDWSRKTGPEEYSANDTRNVSGSLTWKHSPAASTLFAVDFQQVRASAAPAIPEYRPATGRKIVGPYLPLAGFHGFGPDAGVRRRTTAAMVLFDGQPHKKIALRAGLEAWWRTVDQDRFTTSLYNVAMGRFEGTREPRHLEQPQAVQLAHLEVTGRFSALKAEHKLMGAISHTWGDYERYERALSVADRNALPASVRLFDPDAPNYYRPAYSPELYSRVLTDREEKAGYTALELSHRMALQQGRTVITSGLRQDFVELRISDRRVGATMPYVHDRVDQLTYHSGINYQLVVNRLLVFATGSTAFEPSSRVDVRTGRLQPNQMTRGYEAGFKGRRLDGRADMTLSAFSLFNEDISRRNPLYDDPIFDANQTQPQLVASGEETFEGAKIEGRWKPVPPVTISARGAYARAITTASPDLPQEVGRAITRLPAYTASASASYSFPKGKWLGLSVNGSWSYIGSFVATYEDANRERQEYPGYGIAGFGANYSKKRGRFTHGVGLNVRNALDYDFVQKQARLGADREWVANYRLTY